MNCKSCSEELTAYLDGELQQTRFREVEGHIERCQHCLEQLESLRRSSRFVERHLQELEPGPEIWNDLVARIAASRAVTHSPGLLGLISGRPWLTACLALAASIVLGVALLGLWNYRQSEQVLQQYMSSYIQERDLAEQTVHAIAPETNPEFRTVDAQHLEYRDNPFVEVSDEEFQNPFRSEAQ
jgi:anti-sigma factor RsiW